MGARSAIRHSGTPKLEGLLASCILAYFALRLIYLAVSVSPGVPPDEPSHMGIARLYSETLLLPSDTEASVVFGPIAHQPHLYYWLLGRTLDLNPLPHSDLLFARLLNCAMAFATVFVGWRWIRILSENAITRLLFLALITNTLMFTGLSASVNYDNLTNLLAAGATYALFRYFRSESRAALSAAAAIVLAGTLTKTSLLPLALLLLLALLWRERKQLARLASPERWRPRSRGQLAALAGLALLLTANVALYGGNLVRYQRLTPGLEQLVGAELAARNRIVARDSALRDYREGKLDFAEAFARTNDIDYVPDRRSTRALLKMTRRTGDRRLEMPSWAPIWGRFMLQRSYGYFGHRVLLRTPWERQVYALVLGAALLLFLARWRAPAHTDALRTAAFVALGYIAVVMLAVNRVTYLESGLPDFAVQGRYLFPISVPLYGVVAYSLVDLVPRRLQLPLALGVAGFFFYGDLPTFLARTTPEWFAPN